MFEARVVYDVRTLLALLLYMQKESCIFVLLVFRNGVSTFHVALKPMAVVSEPCGVHSN